MARRRMFSLGVINSARFLKMPIDSQVLYFHLGLRADDDGVVEAYPVMKLLGNTEDNLKVLAAKDFVKVLNEDLVSFITDWKEHNLIRSDRKIDSVYKNLLLQILPEVELTEPKPRADTKVKPRQTTCWTSSGRPLDGIGKDRIGKDRIEEDSSYSDNNKNYYPHKKSNASVADNGKTEFSLEKVEEIERTENPPKTGLNYLIDLFKEVNPSYERLFSNKTERAALERLVKKHGEEKVEWTINILVQTNKRLYFPIITSPTQLENKIGNLIARLQKEKENKINIVI